jgi:hypothetical protein
MVFPNVCRVCGETDDSHLSTCEHYVWPDDRGIPEEGGPDSDVPEDDGIRLLDFMPRGNPMGRQEGGDHYSKLPIQPAEYAHRNGLGGLETLALKYITRWRDKNGLKDLRKAIHTLEILVDLETRYPREAE